MSNGNAKYVFYTEQIPSSTLVSYVTQSSSLHSTEEVSVVVLSVLTYYDKSVFESDNTPIGTLEITDGVDYNISIQQFSNDKFSNISTKTIRVPFNPYKKVTVAVKTVDDGNGNVSILVKFFDRETGNKWETSFTINKMSGVKGGIGLYTKNETLIDNVTIQYDKS